MSDKKAIALIGYSGHAYVVLEAASLSGFECIGYCTQHPALQNPYNLDYLGFEGDESFDWHIADDFILGIGDNYLRYKIGKLIQAKNKKTLTITHPNAMISDTVKIGHGNFIGANVIANALASIGDYCILNTGSIIEHECILEDAVHIAPGAILAGNVFIGTNTFIGANAVIKQGVRIGNNVVVGAGSTVLNDIPDNQVWVGNPAKPIKR